MNRKNIYLIRHGEISIHGEKTYIGVSDLPLNNNGIIQAKKLKEYFAGFSIDKIYSSDLKRAIQTSNIIAEDKKLEIIKLKELREINMGVWEGKTFREINNKYPESFEKRIKNIKNFKPENGESFEECGKRAVKVLKKIVEGQDENIIIVAHAGINRTIISYILEINFNNIFKFQQNYGCVNKISFNNNEYRIECINQIV